MAQPIDTSVIQRLIGRTKFRIRSQWALEGATTATILASAGALASIFAVRTEAVTPMTGVLLLVGSFLLVVVGAIVAAARTLDDEKVARKIDRASNLADRLSTAIAFRRDLAAGKTQHEDGTTEEMMHAAIKDGVRAAMRADIRKASPFSLPKDLPAAGGFLVIAALAAGLALPASDHAPKLYRATPDHARPGAVITIEGANLIGGTVQPRASVSLAPVKP